MLIFTVDNLRDKKMKEQIKKQIAYLEKRRGFHKGNTASDFTDCSPAILIDLGRYLQLKEILEDIERNPVVRKFRHVN